MSLAFKQQNKLTVKIGLSAFISLGCKLSLTSFVFFSQRHMFTGCYRNDPILSKSVFFPKVPPRLSKSPERLVK